MVVQILVAECRTASFFLAAVINGIGYVVKQLVAGALVCLAGGLL
jgi:hypothetical protein